MGKPGSFRRLIRNMRKNGWQPIKTTQGATMTTKEIREAAERLHSWDVDEEDPNHVYHADSGIMQDDIRSAVNYIHANVQEDGGLPLDDDWLANIGGELFEYDDDFGRCYCYHMDNDVTLNIELPSRAYLWDVGNDHIVCEIPPITTRSQFRSLMDGLGIDKPSNLSGKYPEKTINLS